MYSAYICVYMHTYYGIMQQVLQGSTEVSHQVVGVENCKLCEIYRKMCDEYDECFSQKDDYKLAKFGLATTSQSREVYTLTLR